MKRFEKNTIDILIFIMGIIILLQNIYYLINYDREYSNLGFALLGIYVASSVLIFSVWKILGIEGLVGTLVLIIFSTLLLILSFVTAFIFREVLSSANILLTIITFTIMNVVSWKMLKKNKNTRD